MFEQLSNRDLAKLQAKFIVPIVVDQMLRDEEPLDDIAEQAMNEILAELQPDTALLCIALCARHIAQNTVNLPEGKALAIEAEKITDEYGPLWLSYEDGDNNMDPVIVREILSYIPEDLESLYELMENLLGALEEDHCVAAILCDILCSQIDEHIYAAEEQLHAANVMPQPRNAQKADTQEDMATSHYSDNVIAFPRSKSQNARA